ncbi:MAG: hypothetical protein ABEH43_11850, partial [Flavobacteriales bacterium]
MKSAKNIVLTLIFTITSIISSFACHRTTISELSSTDNGDGTFTYKFEVCMGSEDTWGFELSFLGANITSVGTSCITDPNTGETICATTPSTSGTGDIEYGDM